MKIYLGGPMFDLPNVRFNLWLAAELRNRGFDVYCPNENATINDKSRSDITPERVYEADITELESSQIFFCQVAEDAGTMWEAGYFDRLTRESPERYRGVIGLASDIRLSTTPDPGKPGVDNQAWAINALVIGGLKLSLGVYTTLDGALEKLDSLRDAP